LVESAFLRLFIAWETFIEDTFIHYMVGTPSARGIVLNRYVAPLDMQHAQSIALGNTRFVDWATPDAVRRLAGLYFHLGDPFESVLSGIHADLLDLKTVRNAAAHLSSTTTAQLDALASRKLGTPVANIGVAAFVTSPDPASVPGESILQTYERSLDAAADLIANA
jgi:hypothetical protein